MTKLPLAFHVSDTATCEYRNRLITDVVLGRLDVRQARATLPRGVRGSDA